MGRCEAEPIRTAYAKSQTAEHFGAVVRAKAVFTERLVTSATWLVNNVKCDSFILLMRLPYLMVVVVLPEHLEGQLLYKVTKMYLIITTNI